MKILHVNDHYTAYGGVEQYLLSVVELLAAGGHENVILYQLDEPGTIEQGLWPAYQLPPSSDGAQLATFLKSIITAEQVDAAYIHHVASAEVVTAVVRALPAVVYVHGFTAVCPGMAKYFRRGNEICERPFGWACVPLHYLRRCSDARHPASIARIMQNTARLKNALLQAQHLIVASRYMRALLTQNGFDGSRVVILPPHFLADDTVLEWKPPEAADTVLYSGRLEIEKGVPYLLRAVAELPKTVQLVVAGDGTLRTEYEQMSVALGISDRVLFTGWLGRADLDRWYSRSTAVVLPTICPEAFGKVGIEAMTWGRPVVAFNVGGISDWLEHGVNGILVNPRSVRQLSQAISNLLQDPNRCASMGRAGQRIAIERYRADAHLALLMETLALAQRTYGQ